MSKIKTLLFILLFSVAVFAADSVDLVKKYGPSTPEQKKLASELSTIKWVTKNDVKPLGDPRAIKGGSFTMGLTSSYPATMRCVGKNSSTTFNSLMEGLVYEAPLSLDPRTIKYAPNLCDKWYVAPDKVTFYFHFDKRAKWQDGPSVTAYDYVATWDLMVNEGLESPFINAYYGKFERPVALTKDVVMVKFKKKEWRSFMSAAFMTVYPEHIIGKIDVKTFMKKYQLEMMPGSGPYIIDKAITNEMITFKRDKDWWGKVLPMNKGTNNFDEIKFMFFSDPTITIEKFKKGMLDLYMVNMARRWHEKFIPEKIEAIKKNWIVRQRIYNERPNGVGGMAFNLREAPFNDIRVRKAFAYLYNRKKMLKKLFFNEYNYKDSYFPNSPYENPNDTKYRYDNDKAIDLLEEAGWSQDNLNDDGYMVKDGKVFEIDLDVVGADSRIQTIVQEDLKNVGIKLNLRKVTWATHIKSMNQRKFKLAEVNYGGILFPNPEGMFHSKYADKLNTNNIFGFKNKRVDEICEQYNVEFDVEKRIKLLQELDKILTDNVLFVLNWYSDNIRILYWNKFGMPEYVLSRFGDHTSSLSYWWYDAKKDKALQKAMKENKSLPSVSAEIKYWKKQKKVITLQ